MSWVTVIKTNLPVRKRDCMEKLESDSNRRWSLSISQNNAVKYFLVKWVLANLKQIFFDKGKLKGDHVLLQHLIFVNLWDSFTGGTVSYYTCTNTDVAFARPAPDPGMSVFTLKAFIAWPWKQGLRLEPDKPPHARMAQRWLQNLYSSLTFPPMTQGHAVNEWQSQAMKNGY